MRASHYDHILNRKLVVDWFEIISENFMIDGERPLRILDQILEQYKVVQHGVSMYFGTAQRADREHLRRLKTLTRRTNTPWLSDHLCWAALMAVCMSLLALGYPADELLLAVRKDVDPSGAASNGVAERNRRRHVTRVGQLKPTPIFLAVHRVDDEVYFRRLDRSQFAVVAALAGGKSLSDAATFALDGTRGGFERTAAVEEWSYNWAAPGWFCAPERCSKKKR